MAQKGFIQFLIIGIIAITIIAGFSGYILFSKQQSNLGEVQQKQESKETENQQTEQQLGKEEIVDENEKTELPSSNQIVCTQQYDPVCGVNNVTYSNECFAKVSKVSVQYKGKCKTESAKNTEEPIPVPAPTPTPAPVSEDDYSENITIQEFTIKADDYGFYPSTITVKKGSEVKITFLVSATEVYFAGLDIRSLKFDTGTVKPGDKTTVSFITNESFDFKSYWPSSGVLKATGKVVVEQ